MNRRGHPGSNSSNSWAPTGNGFFGGMVTSAVEGLEPGSGAFGFITDVRGRVLASATVLALEDRLWLEIPRGRGRTIIDHLEKYIVTDQVEILPLGDMASVRVAGPKSAGVLADLGATAVNDLTEPWSHAQVDILDHQARLVREGHSAVPAFSLWQSSAIAPLLAEDLTEAGIPEVGAEATEALRIEHGYPLWGVDYDDSNLPQETGIDDAVDYEKGCYLGQEIVARIHYRGQPARRMCRLVFAAGHLPSAGAEIEFKGRAPRLRSPASASHPGIRPPSASLCCRGARWKRCPRRGCKWTEEKLGSKRPGDSDRRRGSALSSLRRS